MTLKIKEIKTNFNKPEKGSLLLGEPFIADDSFRKSVVLLTEHNEMGSIGFIVNKSTDIFTQDIVPELITGNYPVYFGGPVEPNTLHFIHTLGELIPGSIQVTDDIYWGGDIQAINVLIEEDKISDNNIRFFVGYSGWENEQLTEEIENKSWWLTTAKVKQIFYSDIENMWADLVKELGEDFVYMTQAPEDISWN